MYDNFVYCHKCSVFCRIALRHAGTDLSASTDSTHEDFQKLPSKG